MTRFYRTHLGFRLKRDYVAEDWMMKDIFGILSPCRIRYLEKSGFGIELFYFLNASCRRLTSRRIGYNHWTMLVADKYRFCAGIKKKKVRVIKIPKPHGFTFFIKDPEKNLIEIKSHEI